MLNAADRILTGVTDAARCRQWLSTLPEDAHERLMLLGRLLVRLGRSDITAEAAHEMLETARGTLIRAVDACLEPLHHLPLPYPEPSWRRLSDAATVLRAMRNQYRRSSARLLREIQGRIAGEVDAGSDPADSTLPLSTSQLPGVVRVAEEAMAQGLRAPTVPGIARGRGAGHTVFQVRDATAIVRAAFATDTSPAVRGTATERAAADATAEEVRPPPAPSGLQLALVRTLDAQSRLLSALLVHRVEPLIEDWDEHCLLGRQIRAAKLLDVEFQDEFPLVEPTTPRALFIHPVLLRLAHLSARPVAEAILVVRLSRHLAAEVGFRIDELLSRENPHGPSLAVSPSFSLRLDTHRLPTQLARRRARWDERVQSGTSSAGQLLGGHSLPMLIDDLQQCWTQSSTVGSGLPPTVGGGQMMMRIGMPMRAASIIRPGLHPESRPMPRVARLIRMAGTFAGDAGDPDPMTRAQTVSRMAGRGSGLAVERTRALPTVARGGLVALRELHAQPVGWGGVEPNQVSFPKPPVRLATVIAVEQLPEPGYVQSTAHRIELDPWPGEAHAVSVRVALTRGSRPAWHFTADDGRESLVLPPGHAVHGARALLRRGKRIVSIRFTELLGSGRGYEHHGYVTEIGREEP